MAKELSRFQSRIRQELQLEIATRERTQLELEHLALRDPLTGLLNRRGFFDALAALNAEQLAGLVLATIDIDRFKHINDQYGHAAGDQVLCTIAQQLQATAGPTAIVTRLGGDEFAAALIDSDDTEKIRLVLSEVSFTGTDHGELKVRCSVGLAPHSDGTGIDTTLARADASLYEEKSRRAAAVHPSTSTASTSA